MRRRTGRSGFGVELRRGGSLGGGIRRGRSGFCDGGLRLWRRGVLVVVLHYVDVVAVVVLGEVEIEVGDIARWCSSGCLGLRRHLQ